MNPALLAQGVATALNGAIGVLRWLRERGASHVKLRELLQEALDGNKDITARQILDLIEEAQESLDGLADKISEKRQGKK